MDGSPKAREVLPLVPIVALVAWVVFHFDSPTTISVRAAVIIAVASGAIVGLPALFWLLDHGRGGFVWVVCTGALVALLPLVLAAASGLIGITAQHGWEATRWLLDFGVTMPATGSMRWTRFADAELSAARIGALSGAVHWMLVLRHSRRAPAAARVRH